jgi:hypothetical protein
VLIIFYPAKDLSGEKSSEKFIKEKPFGGEVGGGIGKFSGGVSQLAELSTNFKTFNPLVDHSSGA